MDQLPQGNYFFQLRSTDCFSYFQAAILARHKRLLSVALARRIAGAVGGGMVKLFDSENAVAGALAVRPSAGWIVGANGSTRVLDLQDDAYYIERVPPGRYSLGFELHGSLQSEISLDLGTLSPPGRPALCTASRVRGRFALRLWLCGHRSCAAEAAHHAGAKVPHPSHWSSLLALAEAGNRHDPPNVLTRRRILHRGSKGHEEFGTDSPRPSHRHGHGIAGRMRWIAAAGRCTGSDAGKPRDRGTRQ